MSSSPAFRPDLYRGTAQFYDRFRLPYPTALIDDLCRRTAASGTGRLLDLACGPGTVTLAMTGHFAEIWAVDQEPEAIAFATEKGAANGVRNVRWIVGRAEDVDTDEVFDAVTIGTAFHRLDRRRVAELAARWLRPGGHLVLLWSDTALNGTEPWQQVFAAVIVDWMERTAAADRLPPDLADHLAQHPHAKVVEDAGFVDVQRHEFSQIHDWSSAALIGLVYSTSLLPRSVLGDRAGAFEADLQARLTALDPAGIFREYATFAYDLAYRPPDSSP